ncbi:hypothetical protein DOM21_04115 [Bacteriovorax stolpii]|uniref:Uncharacterized protein n=1 Tax=Bacteriovorax stolpii TaxID=960 RepID=A0A2K9NV40_BACTC|nr:hypothetical protein [Bacteriovorax stolpii]AUN99367.1 hypothetical protein C0V70_14890 [Bacteriovorax stolpii]QDK40653.1 hypothetical protein DOM21_04115 [Bacteriovorax stolpii]TDP55091.1 hypothetical protein C8D79_0133 [Bacteriovorax stolpii]
MKLFFVVSALVTVLSATASFAGEKINCTSITQPNNRLQIVLTEESRVAGASLYTANQTAEETFSATWAVGSVNPMAGIQVILQNQQVLDIEYAVFEESHDGLVTVNDTEDYSCL